MSLHNAVGHFRTITKHKMMVMENCFQVGLYRQGLLHDLSKYSWEEFEPESGTIRGREVPTRRKRRFWDILPPGFTKGRNKHHFEYWIELAPDKARGLIGNKMPLKYVIEMVMDSNRRLQGLQGKGLHRRFPLGILCQGKGLSGDASGDAGPFGTASPDVKKAGRAENICLYPPSAAAGQLLKRASGAGEADPIQNIPQILERQLRIRLSAGI